MSIGEAREYLIWVSNQIGNMGMEYLSEKDAVKMREAIDILYNAANLNTNPSADIIKDVEEWALGGR